MVLRLKYKFHYSKYPFGINTVDIDKIMISNKVSFGKKGFIYFLGYKNNDEVKPLCVMLPKINGYRDSSGKTRSD